MKKVVLILPDKITYVSGSSRNYRTIEIKLTEADLIKVLCEDDYHIRYKFHEKDVQVISIDDYNK